MPAAKTKSRPARRRSIRRRPRRLLPLLGVALVALVAFLYSRPLNSYFETKAELERRGAEVSALRKRQVDLRLRLASSENLTELEREARKIGLVRPNERLFIVKGIASWRSAGTTKGPN